MPRRRTPWWGLLSATAAPVLLIGGWTVAAARQRGSFDPVVETISALAARGADDRWVMTTALAGLGLCHLTTALALRSAATPGRVVLGVGGVATVLVAAFPQPAGDGSSAAHTAAAGVAFVALAAGRCWPRNPTAAPHSPRVGGGRRRAARAGRLVLRRAGGRLVPGGRVRAGHGGSAGGVADGGGLEHERHRDDAEEQGMSSRICWGVVGAGGIASAFVEDLKILPDVEVVAVGARQLAKAEAFAAEHGVGRAHGSYADLVTDPDVDVVYVSTIHPTHHDAAMLAIEAGKAVLLEKPFTMDADEAWSLVAAARARGVFLMEAMWARFVPHMVRVRELLAEGALGDVRLVIADHCQWFAGRPDPPAARARARRRRAARPGRLPGVLRLDGAGSPAGSRRSASPR